jgi:hypothetical protein
MWPARLYNIFPRYFIKGTALGKKLLKMIFFYFLYNFCLKTLPVIIGNERDILKMYVGLHVKCPLFLSEFNET